MNPVIKFKRRSSRPITPQALAWDRHHLWVSSRDLGMLYKIDIETWQIVEEIDPPGIVWAAVSLGDGEMRFTIGKGLNDDRYIYRYAPDEGFAKLFACPDFTGSFLSFDGAHLYMSQWYEERILEFDDHGNILRKIDIGNKSEEWRIARLHPQKENPDVKDLGAIPFAARSLTFDGQKFWSNHRAANETISFSLAN